MYIVQPGAVLKRFVARAAGFDRFFVGMLDSATFIGGVKLNVFARDIR